MVVLRGIVVFFVCAGAIMVAPRISVTYDAWRLMKGDPSVLAILNTEHRRRILERFVMEGAERDGIRLPLLPFAGRGVPGIGEPIRLLLFVGPPRKQDKGKGGELNKGRGQGEVSGGRLVMLDQRGTIALIVADATTNWFSIERFLQHLKDQKRLALCPYIALAALDSEGTLVWIPMELQSGAIRLGWVEHNFIILHKGLCYVNGDPFGTPDETYRRISRIAETVKPPPRFRIVMEWSTRYGSVVNHASATLAAGCSLYYRLFGEKEVPDFHLHFKALDNGTWKSIYGPPEEEPIGEEEEGED